MPRQVRAALLIAYRDRYLRPVLIFEQSLKDAATCAQFADETLLFANGLETLLDEQLDTYISTDHEEMALCSSNLGMECAKFWLN